MGLLESADSAVAFNAGKIIHCERIMQVDAKIRSLSLSLSVFLFIIGRLYCKQINYARRHKVGVIRNR